MLHRTLVPGQPGTKKFQIEYGEKFLYVRYRYDSEKKQKVKTGNSLGRTELDICL